MSIYTIIPVLSALCTLSLGFFVLFKNPKQSVNRVFFFFTIAIAIWLGGTAILLNTCGSQEKAIFWDRLVYLGVVFIPPTCFHFSSLFAKFRGQKFIIISSYALAILFAFLTQTDLFINGLNEYPWGCHTIAGPFHTIFITNFALFIALVFVNLAKGLKNSAGIEKIQIKYILSAFIVLGIGVSGFLPAYGLNIPPFAYLCGLAAVVIIAYAIFKHHLLNVKVITTEVFSVLVSLVLLVNVLLSNSLNQFFLNVSLFLAISFFSVMLIRSVLKEVKAKEELAALTDKLQKANEDLQKLDKAKSEFISIASHQLRTPLSIIKGFVSMMTEGSYGPITERQKDILNKIYASNERLVHLINDLLDLSRMEGGRMKYEWNFISFAELIDSVVDELKPQAQAKALALLWENKAPDKMYVRADKEKLRQVVMNLIDNGIKYTSHGSVEVLLQKTRENNARLSVRDTGIGMDKEGLAALFGKFVRGKNVPQLWTEGAGLGLYVARKILEEHKGNVWAESPGEGKGSTFYLELPVY